MVKLAVVKTGGKQYLVKENDEIIVDKLDNEPKTKIQLDSLCVIEESGDVTLGAPLLDTKVEATVVEQLKGDKIRVAHFKAKSRYRKVTGFRSRLTKIKIGKLA